MLMAMSKNIPRFLSKKVICSLLVLVSLGVLVNKESGKSWFLEGVNEFQNQYYIRNCKEKKLNANTSWPSRIEQFKMFVIPTDIVMIGDSITHEGHWKDMFPNIKIANRGVGGDRTDDVLRRINDIISLKPNKAFLMVGINDIGWGRCVQDVIDDYLKIIEILQKNNIEIFIQSTIECNRRICGKKLDRVRLLNEKLQNYSRENDLYFINLNEILSEEKNGLLDKYTTDGIHLSGAGYMVWRENLEKYINE